MSTLKTQSQIQSPSLDTALPDPATLTPVLSVDLLLMVARLVAKTELDFI